jgi:predicted kinase
MDETKVGQTYFGVLGSIKDQVADNLSTVCKELNLDQDSIRKIIFVAQSTVDGAGGLALPALLKSYK